MDIPYILPRVVLVEVQDKSGDFYFRVIGTETEDAGNRGYQGKRLSDVKPQVYQDMVRRDYGGAISLRMPTCHRVRLSRWVRAPRMIAAYERVILPLVGTDGTIRFLLTASDWSENTAKEIAEAVEENRAKLEGTSANIANPPQNTF